MINIYICSHLNIQELVTLNEKNPCLIPLQVGVGLDGNPPFDNYIYDNTLDNISIENKFYCELTGHYWVWKNQTAQYYGFFHYRRFLNFNSNANKIYSFDNNYSNLFDKYNYNNFDFIKNYDIILPKKEKFYSSVYTHYANSKNHNIAELDLVLNIIEKKYPDYKSACDIFINDSYLYIGNIFIMKDKYFQEYSTWLFDILFEFDRLNTNKTLRSNGFLSERLLGIYITKITLDYDIKILHLPRVHFENNYKKILTNFILPPSSKRRMLVKKIWRNK